MFDSLYSIYRFLKEYKCDQQYIKIRKEVMDAYNITYDDDIYNECSQRYHKYVEREEEQSNLSVDIDYVEIDYASNASNASNVGSDYSLV